MPNKVALWSQHNINICRDIVISIICFHFACDVDSQFILSKNIWQVRKDPHNLDNRHIFIWR